MLARKLMGTLRDRMSVLSSATATASASTSLAINKPAGVVSGDFLVAFMASNNFSNLTWTGDTGWTERVDQNTSLPRLRVATLTAGGSEPSSYTFTASASSVLTGMIIAIRGAQYDTIGASVSIRAGTGSLSISGVTSAGGILLALCAVANDAVSNGTFSTPSGMSVIGSLQARATIKAFWENVAAGSTGSRATTVGGTSIGSAGGILLGVKPA